MASANPYLNFAGSCMEAFNFYKSVLGGAYRHVSKFSDMPSEKQFWGEYFGSFTDKYGIKWMLDAADPEVAQPSA